MSKIRSTIAIAGVENITKELDRRARRNLEPQMKKAVQFVQTAAKANVPVRDGELRESILTDVEKKWGTVTGTVYTNKSYAGYVEFGTGPKGQANHAGISPDINPTYTQKPWWIHESQIGRDVAESYGWSYIDTPDGRFYHCYGQPAQPYMYPALHDNREYVLKILKGQDGEAV